MSQTIEKLETDVTSIAQRARSAARILAILSEERRNEVLLAAADAIEKRSSEILEANAKDCKEALHAVEEGKMSRALFKRLQTNERGIAQMVAQVRDVARLEDPLGRILAATELDDKLTLYKVSCPLGVIGIVFEARPEVVPQVASLALKSGNAVLLKGGTEAANSNETLVSIWRDVLSKFPDIPIDAVNLLRTREDVGKMLSLDEYIDLIIPRGSKDFVHYVTTHSSIPVLGHGEGVCHVYVDQSADLKKASDIAYDSKVQYPAVCNAMETLLVHSTIAPTFLPEIFNRYRQANVEIRGCPRTIELSKMDGIVPATEEDWRTEYSDLIVSVKVVDNLDQAIGHIDQYGTGHTESIVTEDKEAATRFMDRIDAAGVYHNVSTRFADGFRYGFGAEIGISNAKLHARGPMGLDGLTTYKYKLVGDGHIVASYASGERSFKHRRLPIKEV